MLSNAKMSTLKDKLEKTNLNSSEVVEENKEIKVAKISKKVNKKNNE